MGIVRRGFFRSSFIETNEVREKKSVTRKRLPQLILCVEKRHPQFDNLRRIYQGTNLYEQFELSFTGAGLPSLARRARVPAHSATLLRIHNQARNFTMIVNLKDQTLWEGSRAGVQK